MGSVEWGVWNGECGMGSVEWGVWNGECGMGSVEWECGMGSVEWGVWNGECGNLVDIADSLQIPVPNSPFRVPNSEFRIRTPYLHQPSAAERNLRIGRLESPHVPVSSAMVIGEIVNRQQDRS